jgi:hypothetical protein
MNYKLSLLSVIIVSNFTLIDLSDVIAEVDIPENGHAVKGRHVWDCDKGYKNNRNESCDKVNVPDNGLLASDGHDWHCDKGYRKNDRKKSCDKTQAQ